MVPITSPSTIPSASIAVLPAGVPAKPPRSSTPPAGGVERQQQRDERQIVRSAAHASRRRRPRRARSPPPAAPAAHALQANATTPIRRCQKRGATIGNSAIDASRPANGSPQARAGALGCMASDPASNVRRAQRDIGPMDMTGERRIAGAAPDRMGGAERPGGAEGQHPRLREPGKAVRHRDEGDRRGEDRPDLGPVQRQGAPLRPRSAERLHDQRRGPGRRRRLRQGRRQGAPGRRRHAARCCATRCTPRSAARSPSSARG